MFQKFRISSIIISEIYHFDKSMNAKKFIIAISSVGLLFAGCNGPTFTEPTRPSFNESGSAQSPYTRAVTVGAQTIYVEIVNTDSSRAQGLSGRENLEDGQGMLFDFTNTEITKPSFWMKDMKIDLDIIWINNNTVIGITPNVPRPIDPDNLPTYPPPSNITHVLEVPSGYAERAKIKVGDPVKI